MRVLFINRMASMVQGGGETFDMEIARHLHELGCQVSFLTGIPLFSGPRLSYSGFRFHVSGFHVRSPYLAWFPWEAFKGAWRIRVADFKIFERRAAAWALARRKEFDVVQVCELPFFVQRWKKAAGGVPVCLRLTAPDYHDPVNALAAADAVIASGDTLQKLRAGRRPDCEDIPNGVDTAHFFPHRSHALKVHGIESGHFVVLFVARFQEVKNHRMLVAAFARLSAEVPEARLVLAGSGPLEGAIRQQCREQGVSGRVIFLGEVPYDRIQEIYAAADVHVISSDYESFCFAALEAMATALPLVVTDTDWVPALVGGAGGRAGDAAGGVVVPRRDPDALRGALLALARDPERRRRMGAWNRARVEKDFGWPQSARKLLSVYRRLLDVGRVTRPQRFA